MSKKSSDFNFLQTQNIERYVDLYLSGNEEITTVDPYIVIIKFIDEFSKKKLYICNREPACDCTNYCDCNDDNFALIDFKINLISNNQCIIEFILKENIKTH